MSISVSIRRVRAEIGLLGVLSLAVIGLCVAFEFGVLQPLEARRNSLERRIEQGTARGVQPDSSPAPRLSRFYRFFESGEDAPTQLARLFVIGKAAGLELRSAQYRVDQSGPRIVRYEVTLPLTGSYTQIRSFLTNALTEIPVLSLDQVSMKKDRPGDAPVLADVRMTLHLVKQ